METNLQTNGRNGSHYRVHRYRRERGEGSEEYCVVMNGN